MDQYVEIPIIWYPIENFPQYELSNTGIVQNKKTGRFLKGFLKRSQYVIKLKNESGEKVLTYGRLVYETINGPLPKHYSVYHKNKLKTNNNIRNLVALHQKELGRMTGGRTSRVKSLVQTDESGNVVNFFKNGSVAAKALHYSHTHIYRLRDNLVKNPVVFIREESKKDFKRDQRDEEMEKEAFFLEKLEVAKRCLKQGYCYIIDDCVSPMEVMKCFVADLRIVNETRFYLKQSTGYEMEPSYNYYSNKKNAVKALNHSAH